MEVSKLDLVARHGEREERVRLRRTENGYEVTVGERTYRVGHAAPAPLAQGWGCF